MADQSTIGHIIGRVEALRAKYQARDARAAEVRAVRRGEFDKVAPDLFSDEWPKPIVANRIDVTARHAAAALAPLPLVSCKSVTAKSDSARNFADKRSKIANHYLERSEVQLQMQWAADQFYTYGMIVTSVEPDLDEKFPNVVFEDTIGVYPLIDRFGRTKEIALVREYSALDLCAKFPEMAADIKHRLRLDSFRGGDKPVEVVKYVNADRIVMYLKEADDCVLVDTRNPLGRCTYVVTQKPGLDEEIRGAFDDLIWVQLGLHAMQTYVLSAAAQAVNSPVAVPNDVTDFEVGPGALIRSSDPGSIRRVGLDVPQGAWAAQEDLKRELEYGAITPEALGGSIDASVVTGKGVQQLMAGYSQQIAMCQQSLVTHFKRVVQLCFEMDEKFWPSVKKSIEGHHSGTPYRLDYTAGKDIRGDYTVDVQYGGIAGLDPNRGLVFLLQAQGAGLVSNDYVRRNLPASIDPSEEEAKIVTEQLRNSLIQGVSAYAQSLPQVAANGQDPSEIVAKIAEAVRETQKGKSVEDVLTKLFPVPEEQPQAPTTPEEALAAAMGGGGGGDGMPPGLQPGIATEGPGARPPLEMMFAGLTSSGQPNIQAGVSRYNAARTV